MFNKPYEQVTKADIDALIANRHRELREVDYKRELPSKADKEKIDFLGDVTSFANAAGGYLLYGVAEEAGIPTSTPGLAVEDLDAEMLRLNSLIHAGTSPRVVLHVHPIDGFDQGPVLLVHIPMSWQPPHFLKHHESFRCYTRDDTGKRPMDVIQIRTAFELSGTVQDRIRKFRDGRLARIIAGETPVPLDAGAKLVMHLLPVASFSRGFNIDPITVSKLARIIHGR